jgi:hypothetical protein
MKKKTEDLNLEKFWTRAVLRFFHFGLEFRMGHKDFAWGAQS